MAIPYGKWLAGTDEDEGWACDVSWNTQAEAVAGGPDELGIEPGMAFYVGRCDPPEFNHADLARAVIQNLTESDEACGDFAADWLRHVARPERLDLGERVLAAVQAWMEAYPHNEPGWFIVRKVNEHVVPMSQQAETPLFDTKTPTDRGAS